MSYGKCTLIIFVLLIISTVAIKAQKLGIKGGEDNLDSIMTINSGQAWFAVIRVGTEGTFVLLHVDAGSDSVNSFKVLTPIDSWLLKAITNGIDATKGQWIPEKKERDIVLPLFYCETDKAAKEDHFPIANNFSAWPHLTTGLVVRPMIIVVRQPQLPKR